MRGGRARSAASCSTRDCRRRVAAIRSGERGSAALRPFEDGAVDIATLGVEIERDEEKTNPNVVKIVGSPRTATRLRALYFTRATAPWGEGPLYHHIGLYAYRRAALERFVALGPSPLERRERLDGVPQRFGHGVGLRGEEFEADLDVASGFGEQRQMTAELLEGVHAALR